MRDSQLRSRGDDDGLHRYADLMREVRSRTPLWSETESGEVLRHQLEAEVAMESGLSELGVSYALTEDQFREVHSIKTFRDLLVHADPPEDLLNLVKQFAKAHLSSGASPLPREVAQVLYFGAIVSGLLQGYRAISSLSPGEVRRGAEWAMRLPWMDEDMLRLFKRYINRGTGEGQDCRA